MDLLIIPKSLKINTYSGLFCLNLLELKSCGYECGNFSIGDGYNPACDRDRAYLLDKKKKILQA